MLLIGVVAGLAAAAGRFTAIDAQMYWQAGTSGHLYPAYWANYEAGYLFYPPPVAQLSTLLQPLGWTLFVTLLMTATFGAFWYCARSWSLPLVLMGVPFMLGIGPVLPSTFLQAALLGNLQWILAALTIAAFRYPALWSLELVTKVTTAIGWWAYIIRREWRKAAIAAAASVAVIAVSFALSPGLWVEYLGFAARNYTAANPPIETFAVPLGVRLATGIPLLIWGAKTNRPWTVPIVCGWSLVGVYSFGFLPFWVAALRVRQDGIGKLVPAATEPR